MIAFLLVACGIAISFDHCFLPIELKGFLAYSINAKIVLLPSREFF
jgi:hypothetical protein